MRTDGNLGRTPSYWPNSKGEWTDQPALNWTGVAEHWDHRVDDDHYEQPGDLFRMMTDAQKQVLFENTARAMGDARAEVKQRHIDNCFKADPDYDHGVAEAIVRLANL